VPSQPRPRLPLLATALVGLLGLGACSRASGDPDPQARVHHAHASVDCHLIAQTLTSFELGNYAEPEDRAPRETELAAACDAQELTASDAKCILDATKDTLPFCAKPLSVAARHREVLPGAQAVPVQLGGGLPADCYDYLAMMQRYAQCQALPVETRQALGNAVAQLGASWLQLGQQPMPPQVGDACRQGRDALRQGMQSFGCQ
jgi:hypothetical protein